MKKLLTTMGALLALIVSAPHASAQDSTSITLVHGLVDTTVDVVVDGTKIVSNMAPGMTADITSYAGQTLTDVEVIESGTSNVLIGPIGSLDIAASGNWSIVALLDAAGSPRLAAFENSTVPVDAGNARLTFRHAAEADALDVVISGQRPISGITNGQSDELTLAAGTVSGAEVAPTGEAPIATISDIVLSENTSTIVYIVGTESPLDLAFVTQNVVLPAAATTTTIAGATTTTIAGATTTTTTTVAGATTTTTTTTVATPQAVNTGAPIDGNGGNIALIAVIGGLAVAGGAMIARRRA